MYNNARAVKTSVYWIISFRRSLGFNCMSLNNEPPG